LHRDSVRPTIPFAALVLSNGEERAVLPNRVLAPQIKAAVAARLRLAVGLMDTVEINSLSTEYDIRNSLSRMYYAFFHAGVALLLGSGWNVDAVAKDHGRFHSAMQAATGKYFGTFIRGLYRLRQWCDYDEIMFQRAYGNDIEKARQEFISEIRRARTNFHWLYRTASENLK
jgi:uncharacterized protein (UPF0332 family)